MREVLYHIVYTKRNNVPVMYKQYPAISPGNDYETVEFNDIHKVIGMMDRRVKLKWYKNTDYICWDYTQRLHIFVRDPRLAIKIFTDENLKNYKRKLK